MLASCEALVAKDTWRDDGTTGWLGHQREESLAMRTRPPTTHERYLHAVRDLVAQAQDRGTVTFDAHAGLVAAFGAKLSGAVWQRCRTHYAASLMSITPKELVGWVKALLPSIYPSPTPKPCTPSSTALEVDGQRLAEIGPAQSSVKRHCWRPEPAPPPWLL